MSVEPCPCCCGKNFSIFRQCINCENIYLKHVELDCTSSSSEDSETESFRKATGQGPQVRRNLPREKGPWKLATIKKIGHQKHLKLNKAYHDRIKELEKNNIQVRFRALREPGASTSLTPHEKTVLRATEKCLEEDTPPCQQTLDLDLGEIEVDAAKD